MSVVVAWEFFAVVPDGVCESIMHFNLNKCAEALLLSRVREVAEAKTGTRDYYFVTAFLDFS